MQCNKLSGFSRKFLNIILIILYNSCLIYVECSKKEMYVLVHIKFTLIVERKTDLIHQHVELRHRWLATYISHRPCPTKQQVKNLIKVFESGLRKVVKIWGFPESKSGDFPNHQMFGRCWTHLNGALKLIGRKTSLLGKYTFVRMYF